MSDRVVEDARNLLQGNLLGRKPTLTATAEAMGSSRSILKVSLDELAKGYSGQAEVSIN